MVKSGRSDVMFIGKVKPVEADLSFTDKVKSGRSDLSVDRVSQVGLKFC